MSALFHAAQISAYWNHNLEVATLIFISFNSEKQNSCQAEYLYDKL